MTSPTSTPQQSAASSGPSQPSLSRQSTLLGGTSSPKPAAGDFFDRELKKFRARLSGTHLQDFRATDHAGLLSEIGQIQRSQEDSGVLMNLGRIKSFLEAMDQFGKVIEIFLNAADAVAFVWGPMKFLLLTASTFADSFDLLLDAYAQIGEQLPMLLDYRSLFSSDTKLLDALKAMYIDILEFHQEALKFFTGSLWKRFLKSIQNQYRKYRDDMRELKSKLDKALATEQLKMSLEVKQWLAVGAQVQQEHETFLKIRQEYVNTACWILKHDAIIQWLGTGVPHTPVLWLHGILGAASAIIDKCKSDTSFTTGYFYCHDGDQTSNSAVGILKGIIDQLLDEHPQMLPVYHARRMHSREPILNTLAQACKVLEELCTSIPKVYVVVDGLDECDSSERKQTLKSLLDIASSCDLAEPGKLRLLVVSRNDADIRQALHSSSVTRMVPNTISISPFDNESDIRTYTKIWVNRIAMKFSPLHGDTLEYLSNLTIANAKGMFLYAKLVLQNLHDSTTQAEMLDAIRESDFPDDIKAAKLLGWMVCAKRRLTWKEIQVAISINTELQTVEYESRRVRDHIYETCGSLILLSGDQVSLVHSTAKRYITMTANDAIDGALHEPSVECELATLCLQYLTFPCFDYDPSPDEDELRQFILNGHLAFEDYAVANWFHHLTAWAHSGTRFLNEAPDQKELLHKITIAMDDFMIRYQEEEWDNGIVDICKTRCGIFGNQNLYDSLVLLMSHIYTFQTKGFNARHAISIKNLSLALERNRQMLEQLPSKLTELEKTTYRKFYDDERLFKCSRITCRFFSEGFRDHKARKRHVDIHNRPYQCEVLDCHGAAGFASQRDLEKHVRGFHPELSDLAKTFNATTAAKANANHACTFCGKTFTRNFHRKHHEASHRGERPHKCPECGKAFTRLNDLKRHQKLHNRK
ncbi:C2H2 domain-containing protein [Plenodomus tracheiphilus IPT5]|uniref:C2H2 domain-containing protein n=1 Tax=Plenodomus tracheiphilus IPT5 TaxID=1408161 RepID=A0A6A7AVF5_9PLEO|nr:C2H2 domain-containing protein [Plenodomus tracheiphilus IPT5]